MAELIAKDLSDDQYKRLELFVTSCMDGVTLSLYYPPKPPKGRKSGKLERFSGKDSNKSHVFDVNDLVVARNASHDSAWRVTKVTKIDSCIVEYELQEVIKFESLWKGGKQYPNAVPLTGGNIHSHLTTLGNDNLREYIPDQLAPED